MARSETVIIFRADLSPLMRALERANYQYRVAASRMGVVPGWRVQEIGLGVSRCPVDRDMHRGRLST